MREVLDHRDKYLGQVVPLISESITGAQVAAQVAAATGEKTQYDAIPPAVFATFGFPGAGEIAAMFELYAGYPNMGFPAHPASIVPLRSFADWLKDNKLF